LHNPADLWQQECIAMTKHTNRASNLANGDFDLVGATTHATAAGEGSEKQKIMTMDQIEGSDRFCLGAPASQPISGCPGFCSLARTQVQLH